jgi:hypothetical protein
MYGGSFTKQEVVIAMTNAKRIFYYLVCLTGLGIMSGGAGILLSLLCGLIPGNASAVIGGRGFNNEQLSLGLSMLITGGALWGFFWHYIQGNVALDKPESGSSVRKLYLTLIQLAAALIGVYAAMDVCVWLLGGADAGTLPSGRLATWIVATVCWYYHWHLSEKEGHTSQPARMLRGWYIYILSGWGLVMASASLMHLMENLIIHLPFWGHTIISGPIWNRALQGNISGMVFGGITWYFHWFRMAQDDHESMLRQIYIYLLTISGSAIAGIVALTNICYRLIRYIFGGVVPSGAAYFKFTGWAIPLLLISLLVWLYHRRLVQEEAYQFPDRKLSGIRIHVYIMAFLSLGTLVAGLVILMGILLDLAGVAMASSATVSSGWWRDQLSLCMALLLAGIPLWIYYWNQIKHRLTENETAERQSSSRRVFLYAILSAGVILLAADLVNIIYQLLSCWLQSRSGTSLWLGIKWSLQTLVIALPLVGYFWRIIRQDQRYGAEMAARHKRVMVLISAESAELVKKIEEKLGYGVIKLWTSGQLPAAVSLLSEDNVSGIASEVQSASSQQVMLLVWDTTWKVIPYQEG